MDYEKIDLGMAFYKRKLPIRSIGDIFDKLSDWVIRLITRGPYSHCELVYMSDEKDYWMCYSSSGRDGGVRCKKMKLNPDHWDIVPIEKFITSNQHCGKEDLIKFHELHVNKKYDWRGAIGIGLGLKDNQNKLFCSEYCSMFLKYPESWRYSPNQLAAMSKIKESE